MSSKAIVAVIMALTFYVDELYAQAFRDAIQRAVNDSSGAAVPHDQAIVTGEQTQFMRQGITVLPRVDLTLMPGGSREAQMRAGVRTVNAKPMMIVGALAVAVTVLIGSIMMGRSTPSEPKGTAQAPQAISRIDYDLDYIEKWSLRMDIGILVNTVRREFLSGSGF